MAPHWPRPWGLDADPIHQILIDEELTAAGVRRPSNTIGIGWAGPTIVHGGTRGAEGALPVPAAGGRGDLVPALQRAGLGLRPRVARTRAVRDGDEWVVNGQKIWTSLAQHSKLGILIARTDPDAPEARGHLVLHLPDGHARHRDPPDHRDDRARTPSTRCSSTTCASRPRTSSARSTAAGGSPRSPSATSGCRCPPAARCGGWAPPRRPARRRARGRRHRATRCCASASPRCTSSTSCCGSSGCAPSPRASRASRRAPRRRSARSSPTSTARRSWAWPRTWPAPAGCSPATAPARCPAACGTTASCSPGPHRRRRHRRGAAQHRRRAGARPAPRRRRRAGPDLGRVSAAAGVSASAAAAVARRCCDGPGR